MVSSRNINMSKKLHLHSHDYDINTINAMKQINKRESFDAGDDFDNTTLILIIKLAKTLKNKQTNKQNTIVNLRQILSFGESKKVYCR